MKGGKKVISDIINPEMIIESLLKGFMIVLSPLIPYLKSALIGTVSVGVVVWISKWLIDYFCDLMENSERQKNTFKNKISSLIRLIFHIMT